MFVALLLIANSASPATDGSVLLGPSNAEVAHEHRVHGQQLFDVGNFSEAIVEFDKCYQVNQDPECLHDLAQAHFHLKDWEQVVFFDQRYLQLRPATPIRRAVEAQIAEAQALHLPPPQLKTTIATPVYEKWWFWASIGAGVVVAGAVTAGVVLSNQGPAASFGVADFRH